MLAIVILISLTFPKVETPPKKPVGHREQGSHQNADIFSNIGQFNVQEAEVEAAIQAAPTGLGVYNPSNIQPQHSLFPSQMHYQMGIQGRVQAQHPFLWGSHQSITPMHPYTHPIFPVVHQAQPRLMSHPMDMAHGFSEMSLQPGASNYPPYEAATPQPPPFLHLMPPQQAESSSYLPETRRMGDKPRDPWIPPTMAESSSYLPETQIIEDKPGYPWNSPTKDESAIVDPIEKQFMDAIRYVSSRGYVWDLDFAKQEIPHDIHFIRRPLKLLEYARETRISLPQDLITTLSSYKEGLVPINQLNKRFADFPKITDKKKKEVMAKLYNFVTSVSLLDPIFKEHADFVKLEYVFSRKEKSYMICLIGNLSKRYFQRERLNIDCCYPIFNFLSSSCDEFNAILADFTPDMQDFLRNKLPLMRVHLRGKLKTPDEI